MALRVDQLSLGPIGTNCYVVRAEAGSSEAVVVDPSGDATEIRLTLARLGAQCAAILVTHGHFDHLLGVADLAEGTGAPVHMPEGERMLLESPQGGHAGRTDSASAHAGGCCSPAARRSRSRVSPSTCCPSPATRRLTSPTTRTAPLLRRRALRRVGRAHRPPGRRLGHAARVDSHARRHAAARDGRVPRPRADHDARARSSRGIRSSPTCARSGRSEPRGTNRATARHARRRSLRAAALDARHVGDRAAVRALRLSPDPDAGLRGHGALRADVRLGLGRRPEGDVHVRGSLGSVAHAAPGGDRADLPRVRRARLPPRAAAREALHDRVHVPLRRARHVVATASTGRRRSRRSEATIRRSTRSSSSSTTRCSVASA